MEIKNRFTGEVIHSGDFKSMKDLVIDAINRDANLRNANLRDANLWSANLRDANLRDANLWGANLGCADLRNANLEYANLEDANLRNANLINANLEGADLEGANLRNANLINANLEGADLGGANLINANLRGCSGNRNQIRSIFVSDAYPITYTSEILQIGCELHKISEWWSFDNDRIEQMDGKAALDFWTENKEFIKMTIEKYPATETKHQETEDKTK